MNERDEKYESHDEGEYHFSDEHATYEVDHETAKVGDVAVAKQSPLANLSKSKRALIALGVFFTLMFIVYKMLMPATTTTPIVSDVATANQSKPLRPAKALEASSAPVMAVAPASSSMQAQQPPGMSTMPGQQVMPGVMAGPAVAGAMPQQSGAAPQALDSPQDRLAAAEQQTAKLANELHTDYQQKMADYETQSSATQAKLQELSTRVASMEAALAQITQLLQNSSKQTSVMSQPTRASRSAEPKQLYTVQAIIPGRAWLKSDAGDTVTVAEGDILRDYGRVTKIDPYDGVVDIDTGNKTVSLSYGAGGD